VVVAIDGSSLTLPNHSGTKDFGRIGSYRGKAAQRAGNGLKVISSIVMDPAGTPVGLVDQQWWVRTNDPKRAVARGAQKKQRIKRTPLAAKETQRWLDAIAASERRFKDGAAAVGRCYVLDREADSRPVLTVLAATGQAFIVRASWDRRLEPLDGPKGKRDYLRLRMAQMPVLGSYPLDVDAGPARTARRAQMVVRAGSVTLQLRDAHRRKRITRITLQVVWAREIGTTPAKEKALDWMLLTNQSAQTFEQALDVVRAYAMRWRIEDFHRTWKSGHCDVEAMQLRSAAAAMKWATVLAAVAARTERLKHLARTQPDEPASVELTKSEIRVLIVLKRDQKKKTETIPDTIPTIGQATLWIAELGGYTGKSSGGPPGSTTIGRGLAKVRAGAKLMQLLKASEN
jgi:ketosteroid isomerase-like protein